MRLDLSGPPGKVRIMKSGPWILPAALGFAAVALGGDMITPTNRLELFNGRDLSGFTFCMKNGADPAQTWCVTNGVIQCTGQPTGYLRTTQGFSNYDLTVEWRFVSLAPAADNTGFLVHVQPPDQLWPQCVQVQGRHEHVGDLFLMAGAESKEHLGRDANTPLPLHGEANEKPVGEWNTTSVICSGHTVQAVVNGRPLNEATECTVSSGFVGVQSEGAVMEIRKLYLEPLSQTASH
jgi:hypothetical protein